jgi:hypothetical protein
MENGWHQPWCLQPDTPEVEWPPALQLQEIGTEWQPMVNPNLHMDIPLPQLEIGEVNVDVETIPVTEVDSEATASSISWDMVGDIARNVGGSDVERQQEERVLLEQCIPVEGCRVGPSTPINPVNGKDSDLQKLWVSASQLAEALSKYVEEGKKVKETLEPVKEKKPQNNKRASSSEGTCHECCHKGTCETKSKESPSSPEPESDPEINWDSDESEVMPAIGPYQPEVSSISSDMAGGTSGSMAVHGLRSGLPGYWKKPTGAKSIAHIRPQTRMMTQERRRALLNRRRMVFPPGFRMVSHSPIIRTHDVLSRVILVDGTIVEESMNTTFVMARTVSTQTPPADMVTEVENERVDRERELNNEVDVVIDLTLDENSEDGDNESTEEYGTPPVVDNAGPGINEVGDESSTGTPVQDERYP